MPDYTYSHDRGTYWTGDTLPAWSVQLDGLSIDSVCCQLRSPYGSIAHTFTADIVGDTVTLHELPAGATADWSPGTYSADIEFTLADGTVKTYITWKVAFERDISKC